LVAFTITVRDGPQLANVGDKSLVTKLLQLFADPDRMGLSFHHDPGAWQIGKPLIDAGGCCSEPLAIDNYAVLVKHAVMAPDISKVDPDRHLSLRAAAWNFSDEVIRMLFHGK
jgi:hypothetical protein